MPSTKTFEQEAQANNSNTLNEDTPILGLQQHSDMVAEEGGLFAAGTNPSPDANRIPLQHHGMQELLALQARERQLQQQLGQRGNHILSALQEQERANMMLRNAQAAQANPYLQVHAVAPTQAPVLHPAMPVPAWFGVQAGIGVPAGFGPQGLGPQPGIRAQTRPEPQTEELDLLREQNRLLRIQVQQAQQQMQQAATFPASVPIVDPIFRQRLLDPTAPLPTRNGEFERDPKRTRLACQPGVGLSIESDESQLSGYQILIRKCLEYFKAGKEDVETKIQGRKKDVLPDQVGVRCRFCADIPIRLRGKASVYYPLKLSGVYQAAQNMAVTHLSESCMSIPEPVRAEILNQREMRDYAGGGKAYWTEACEISGLVQRENGIWFGDDKDAEKEEKPEKSPDSHE